VVEGAIADWRLSPNGEQVVVRRGKAIHQTPLEKLFSAKSPGVALQLDQMVCTVNPVDEWLQIFDDAWRWYRDFFYDRGCTARLEGDGQDVPGDGPGAVVAERAELAAVADGGGALRLAHVRQRRRHGAEEGGRSARLYGAARRRPRRGRQRAVRLPLGPAAVGPHRRPDVAAGPPRT